MESEGLGVRSGDRDRERAENEEWRVRGEEWRVENGE